MLNSDVSGRGGLLWEHINWIVANVPMTVYYRMI
jgi:hypothetical protein